MRRSSLEVSLFALHILDEVFGLFRFFQLEKCGVTRGTGPWPAASELVDKPGAADDLHRLTYILVALGERWGSWAVFFFFFLGGVCGSSVFRFFFVLWKILALRCSAAVVEARFEPDLWVHMNSLGFQLPSVP